MIRHWCTRDTLHELVWGFCDEFIHKVEHGEGYLAFGRIMGLGLGLEPIMARRDYDMERNEGCEGQLSGSVGRVCCRKWDLG
jgi:hypothetical protein